MECSSAWQVRAAYWTARNFLNNTGWKWSVVRNANTQRAL